MKQSKFYFKDLITWKKQRGIGMRKGWLYTREECLWYVKNNKHFIWNKDKQYSDEKREVFANNDQSKYGSDKKRWTNVWTDINEEGMRGGKILYNKNIHIAQKPVKAIKRIIEAHTTNENNIVLDCFMGSGTTAIACLETNRNYIGFENNKEYYNLCQNRINTYLQNK